MEQEDPCQWGFLDIIHCAIKQRGYWRDWEQWENLETELRMHLVEQRALIEQHDFAASYVRKILNNKLIDLQKTSEFKVQQFSDSYESIVPVASDLKSEFDASDPNERNAAIMDSLGAGPNLESSREATATRIVEANHGTVWFNEANIAISAQADPKDANSRKKQSREQENSELVRAAIEEQGHRLDAFTAITRREQAHAVTKAHGQLLKAIETLPHDERITIKLRFLDGNDLRDGKPRSRADILRELRINGNGASAWSEWDLRRLEQQAVIRLRGKIDLPAIFKQRE